MIRLPYGDRYLALDVPAQNLQEVIYPHQLVDGSLGESEILRKALDEPVAAPHLRELARKGQRVAIVTSDFTRPCPSGTADSFHSRRAHFSWNS